MAKTIKKNDKIIIVLIISFIDRSKVFSIFLRAFIVDIVLNGLRILSALSDAKLPPPEPLNSEINEVTTIMKSSIFQLSLRYEFLSQNNPMATIFKADSTP